jgi:hypothetical protein
MMGEANHPPVKSNVHLAIVIVFVKINLNNLMTQITSQGLKIDYLARMYLDNSLQAHELILSIY